jgi:hypothetical protein
VAKKVSGWSVGRGSSLSAVSRGRLSRRNRYGRRRRSHRGRRARRTGRRRRGGRGRRRAGRGLRQRVRDHERQRDDRACKQNPQRHATGPDTRETRFMRPNDSLCTLRLPNRRRPGRREFSIVPRAIMPLGPEMQRPPREAAFLRASRRSGSHSMPDESRLLRPRRKPAKPRPQTQSAMSAHADDSGDA